MADSINMRIVSGDFFCVTVLQENNGFVRQNNPSQNGRSSADKKAPGLLTQKIFIPFKDKDFFDSVGKTL